jgi:hypothetical protein
VISQSPLLYVSETKRYSETISYFGDFRDVLSSGEAITSQLVTVTCISGDDPDPSAMLYSGIEVHNGNTIEQRIEEGVIGATYDILFTVGTSLNNTFQKFTRLVILPDNLTAEQQHTTFWFTTYNYPYNMAAEGIQGIGNLSGGPLWYNPSFGDQFQGSAMLLSGSLFVGATSYSMVPEAIQGSAVLLSGTITLAAIFYTDVPDAIQGNAALLNGTFYQGQVSFTNPAEAIQGNATLNSGTLM